MKINRSRRVREGGSALLAVLWLSAALAAIAFSLTVTVRGEMERSSTALDGLRAYYLARGGVERAEVELFYSVLQPNNRLIPARSTEITYHFESGDVRVEFLPETGKLDINRETPEVLTKLMLALGIEGGLAEEIVEAIVDWRNPSTKGSAYDDYYLSLTPSFQPLHTSFEEIEELLQVKGVTPDLFYGTYAAGSESLSGAPSLKRQQGLVDCLSVFGARGRVDANTAPPAVLAAVGLPEAVIAQLLDRRRSAPFTQDTLVGFLGEVGFPSAPLRVEGNSILTIRGTARLRVPNGKLSDLRRTVAAQIKYMPTGADSFIHTLRWYDTAWSD